MIHALNMHGLHNYHLIQPLLLSWRICSTLSINILGFKKRLIGFLQNGKGLSYMDIILGGAMIIIGFTCAHLGYSLKNNHLIHWVVMVNWDWVDRVVDYIVVIFAMEKVPVINKKSHFSYCSYLFHFQIILSQI
jgi:hypothetical protein